MAMTVLEMVSQTPLLSVVVIGRNEGVRLQRCIESVKNMQEPRGKVEIIYVDSASTDGSRDLAQRLDAQVIAIQPARPTAALGRNAGWRASSGRFVLFLDGDTILDPSFVVESLPEFAANVAVVFGNRRELHPEASIFNAVLDLDWMSPIGLVDSCGGDALIRREALEAVGGYDETLIAGEEPEMCRRMRALGWNILHSDRPMTGHDLAMTKWSQYLRRSLRTGYAYAEVSARFRGTGMPFWEFEARHNRNRALMQAAIILFFVLASIIWRSPLPLGLLLAVFLLLSLRSAMKAAKKIPRLSTQLLYGVHSHLQQIPIYIGQLQYWNDRRQGRIRGLIEYKEAAQ
jgi:glycosyltransferase involved in cell wall biosynthesis